MEAKAAMIEAAFGPGEIAARALEETRAKHLTPRRAPRTAASVS